MPYFLHDQHAEPTTGQTFTSKPDAIAARQAGQTITFAATDTERADWRARESARFASGTYIDVPWLDDPTLATLQDALLDHYAHLSVSHPGMVAYTPNDESGVQDRQTRVRPGKYLKDFAPSLSEVQIERYTSQVRAISDRNNLKLATTADDIEAAYTVNGDDHRLGSCMAYRARHFNGPCHPVRVYGDSDLAVAYLGDLTDHVSARCLVWPERKLYCRVYGDSALAQVLEANGYEHASNFDGARVRRIAANGHDRFVMPYFDCGSGVSKTSDRAYFEISDSWDYEANSTDGVTGHVNNCSECGEACDDDETYCTSCLDNSFTCDDCGERHFSDNYYSCDDSTYCDHCWGNNGWRCNACDDEHYGSSDRNSADDGEVYCDTCYNAAKHECRHCEAEFNEYDSNSGSEIFCDDCDHDHDLCMACDHVIPSDVTTCPVCAHTVRCDRTRDLFIDLDRPERPIEPLRVQVSREDGGSSRTIVVPSIDVLLPRLQREYRYLGSHVLVTLPGDSAPFRMPLTA